MQVAVIGGGVVGVCTAYFLAAAGHHVVVIERYGNVAQETSFGNGGLTAPAHAGPWAMPGMPRKLLSYLFKPESPLLFRPRLDPALWRWLRRWKAECEIDRFRINRARMHRLAAYSRDLLRDLRESHELDYEQSTGVLSLFRTQRDLQLAQPALEFLAQHELAHRMLDPDEARAIEPALSAHAPLAAALHLPQDEAGNCPLFTRQLKAVATEMGVEFHFNSTVTALVPEANGIGIRIGDRSFSADAVVVAGGSDSTRLLEPLGIHVPLYPVKGYSATAFIKNFESAPLTAVVDETYDVSMTRMGSRVRIAGTAELGASGAGLRGSALRTLAKVGEDWFPDAANYHTATFWSGRCPMLPDGPPLLGATPVRHLYLNIGHGSAGWAMAAGSGKAVADIVSGQAADIDLDGLTLARMA